jgi:hypothetical protein
MELDVHISPEPSEYAQAVRKSIPAATGEPRVLLHHRQLTNRLVAAVSTVRSRPILLKNSFSNDDGKILGVIRREARSRLGGYMKGLMSRCRTS